MGSVTALRHYLAEFHTEYNVANRPKVLKNALERAEDKGWLVRVTGKGFNGTFRLSYPYMPSPKDLWREAYVDPDQEKPAKKKKKVHPRRKKLSPSQKEQKINPWPRNPHLKSRHLRRNPLRKSQQLRNQSMSKILTVNLRKNLPRKSMLKKRVRRKLSQNMFLKKENVELHLPEVPFRPKNQKWPKSHQ